MQDPPSTGPPSYNPKLHCLLTRPSTLLCHKRYVTSSLSWTCYRKWGSETSRSFVQSLMYTARYLRTSQVLWNLQDFPSYAQGPITETVVIIIFENMHARDSSKYSQLIPKTRLPTQSQKLWYKMTSNIIIAICAASDLSKPPKWGSVT